MSRMKRGIVLALILWGLALVVLGQDTLQVMTYNVRHCAGMDWVLDYDHTNRQTASTTSPLSTAKQRSSNPTSSTSQRPLTIGL